MKQRVLPVLLALLMFPALAETPPPLVGVVTLESWLAAPEIAAAPDIAPDQLVSLAEALAGQDDAQRWRVLELLAEKVHAAAGNPGTADAWAAGLLTLDAALQDRMVALPELVSETPRSFLQVWFDTAARLRDFQNAAPANDRLLTVRHRLLRLSGLVLPKDQWAQLQPFYAEPALRPAVLNAWVTMQSSGARTFMETRLLSNDERELLDLAPAVARMDGDTQMAGLIQLIQQTPFPSVYWTCLDVLSQRGLPPVQVAGPPRPDFTPEEKRRYVTYTLRSAHVVAAAGSCNDASKIYLDAVERNLSDVGVRAGLEGLAQCEYEKLYALALGYINDPALRPIIIRLLINKTSPEEAAELRRQWDGFPPLTQAALLEVFAAQNADEAAPLLQRATTSLHTPVRYRAQVLLGQTPSEEDLWELSSTPPDWLQQEALRAYLNLADARIAQGEVAEARRQYLLLLEGGMPQEVELAAVEGLGRTGEPGDKFILEQLSAEMTLRSATERALVALAGRAGDTAEKVEAVAMLTGREIPQQEMESLLASIPDAEARKGLLARAGFFSEGRVLGPLPAGDASGMAQLHFPIVPFPPTKPVPYNGETLAWTALEACATGIRYNVTDCLAADAALPDQCAWLSFDVRVHALTGVSLHVHHDDGFSLWLNGKLIRTEQPTGDEADWTRFSTVLEPGYSNIILKLPQRSGDWFSGLRITQRDGKPFDLTQQRMPDDQLKDVGVGSGQVKQILDNVP